MMRGFIAGIVRVDVDGAKGRSVVAASSEKSRWVYQGKLKKIGEGLTLK
jgi:hypothetical protein